MKPLYESVLPLQDDQRFVFSLLLDAIAYCEQLGCPAWSVTQLADGFRLNVGKVEAMTCRFTFWAAGEFGIEQDTTFVDVRLLLAGSNCLGQIALPHEVANITEMSYTSVGAPHWCYRGTFSAAQEGAPDASRTAIEDHVAALRANHQAFLALACQTPTGKTKRVVHGNLAGQGSGDGIEALLQQFISATASLPQTTEVERLVVQRVGQDLFRAALLDYWQGQCCVTGLAVPELLRASHIRPWSKCETDAQRLDVFNGFLLTPNLDELFDGGWVTFSDAGDLMVSSTLPSEAVERLGLLAPLHIQTLRPEHGPYLSYHRANIFRR